jgi:hypothetical protein
MGLTLRQIEAADHLKSLAVVDAFSTKRGTWVWDLGFGIY